MYSLWRPKHNEIVSSLVQKVRRISRWWDQSIQSSVGPSVTKKVTWPWPEQSTQSWTWLPLKFETLSCMADPRVSYTMTNMHCHGELLQLFLGDGIFFLEKPLQVYFQRPCTMYDPTLFSSPSYNLLGGEMNLCVPPNAPLNKYNYLRKKLLPLYYRGFQIK